MQIGELGERECATRLADGMRFALGPFVVDLISDVPGFSRTFRACYSASPLLPSPGISHFSIEVRTRRGPRSLLGRQQVEFLLEGIAPFEPYPVDHAFPMFEWGLNWCIANTAHQYVMLHAAAVEFHEHTVIMPAQPGAGKSTLCAGLVSRGWRLFSDEFGLLRPADGRLQAMPRAIPLKNESIAVMQDFAPRMQYGPVYDKTRKGSVCHVFPREDSLANQATPGTPRMIVFPLYRRDADTALLPFSRSMALTRLVNNSFNYLITGEAGFHALCTLVGETSCHTLVYSSLEDATSRLEQAVLETSS